MVWCKIEEKKRRSRKRTSGRKEGRLANGWEVMEEERKSAAITRRKEGNVNGTNGCDIPCRDINIIISIIIIIREVNVINSFNRKGHSSSRHFASSSPSLPPISALPSLTEGEVGVPNIVGWMLPEDVWTLGLAPPFFSLPCLRPLPPPPPFRGFEFPLF